ncbi:MAG: hypothetical protein KME59_06070 [Trichormus sp. ATA11-4-KO1]|jgi:hypothetical protein|nr:hypothetical protein [Trichormus sp. ATA11-4-KO1]
MKEVIKNVKVAEIPGLIAQLGLSSEQRVNVTIEQLDHDLISIMEQVGKKAQERGLTEEKLAELLRDES